MATDYSIGFTEEEVLEILSVQKAELKKTLQSFSDSGSSATKRRLDEINSIIIELPACASETESAKIRRDKPHTQFGLSPKS